MAGNNRSWVERRRDSRLAGRALNACVVCCLSLIVAGCASHATKKKCPPHDGHDCVICPTGFCGGYYPTCWRMWPADCPTCPPEPEIVPSMPAPIDGERAPVEGELVLPPSQSAANRPVRTPAKDRGLVSHRRPRPATNNQDHTSAPKPAPSRTPASPMGERKPQAPAAGRPVNRQASAGNVINLLSGTAPAQPSAVPIPASPAAGSQGHERPAASDAPGTHAVERPNHAVVSWRFSSAEAKLTKPQPPATSIASDAAPLRLRSGGDPGLIESILSATRPSPAAASAASAVVGPTLPPAPGN